MTRIEQYLVSVRRCRRGLICSALISAAVLLAFAANLQAQTENSNRLVRSTPEAEGVSSEAIGRLMTELDAQIDTMNSLMILRHGKVIAECWWTPHTPDTPHALYSLTKSFTSTAIGFAVAEGKLSLDDKVISFFPDQTPAEISDYLNEMSVEHLLSMSCGHDIEVEWPDDNEWVKAFLAHPIVHQPGTHFQYNTPGSFMLSVILQQATGQTTEEWLMPRLFEPLGIVPENWEKSPNGVTIGGKGLWLRTEDIAKFGQFCLQKGVWNGKRLLPAEWIENASSKHISNGSDPDSDWAQGYGFQFWRCRHNIYRGDGAYCQFCVVIPDKDMVIASTADSSQYGDILDLYWDILLPAAGDEPLAENPDGIQEMEKIAQNLTVKPGCSGNDLEENLSFESAVFGGDIPYDLYLPRNYLTYGWKWPLLCIINRTGEKADSQKLAEAADSYFIAHPDQKRIIAVITLPAGNEAKEKQFLNEEFFPALEGKYRILPDKNELINGFPADFENFWERVEKK